jgi:hypothetical protein
MLIVNILLCLSLDTENVFVRPNDNDLFKVEKHRKWSPNLPSQRFMLKALDYYNYIYTKTLGY